MNTFEKARRFIYRNARPLDLAVFKYFVPWNRGNDHKEWYIAENRIKSELVIDNMLFLRKFDLTAL